MARAGALQWRRLPAGFELVGLTPGGAATAQLKNRGYTGRYRSLGQPVRLIGVEFSKDTRNVAAYEVEGG